MTLRQREQVASISLFLNRPWLNYNPDHRRRGCNSTTEHHSPPPNHSYIVFLPHPRPPPSDPLSRISLSQSGVVRGTCNLYLDFQTFLPPSLATKSWIPLCP